METVVSGIRSTGNLHLGNYLGAIRNFVQMQHEYRCFFFIADYHALTTHPDPTGLRENVLNVLSEYIACGLDPDVSTIYIQSDVPQVTELYLLLNMHAYMGELERSTTFKEKARKQPDNVNAGLLTYPVLMAADILLHNAVKVPVGKDQEQHLEMTRQFGNRFNRLYKTDFFNEPAAFNYGNTLVKIPGLDGAGKMGKSEGEGNALFLADSPDIIRKKVMKAVTDVSPTVPDSPVTEPVKNLFTIMQYVSTEETCQYFLDRWNDCTIRFGDLKKQLAEDMIVFLTPFREKIEAIRSDKKLLNDIMEKGKLKATKSASETLSAVREIMGIKYY